MTEAEWWLSEYLPEALVSHLCRTWRLNRTKAGRRKLWLFACARYRRIWDLIEAQPTCAALVVAAERFADGEMPFAEVQRIRQQVVTPSDEPQLSVALAVCWLADTNALVVATVAEACASARSRELVLPSEITRIWWHEQTQATNILRCIFGNPFRPITFDPAWRTSDAVALARGIYDDRAFDRMPILADALQDAGCDNDHILNHCRDTDTPHARGCWVVDLVLGKV